MAQNRTPSQATIRKQQIQEFARSASSWAEVLEFGRTLPGGGKPLRPETIKAYAREGGASFLDTAAAEAESAERKSEAAKARSAQTEAVNAFVGEMYRSDAVAALKDEAAELAKSAGGSPIQSTASAYGLLDASYANLGKAIREREAQIAAALPDGEYLCSLGTTYEVSTKMKTDYDNDAFYESLHASLRSTEPESAMEEWNTLHGKGAYRIEALRGQTEDGDIDRFFGEVVEGPQGLTPFLVAAERYNPSIYEFDGIYKGFTVDSGREAFTEYSAISEEFGSEIRTSCLEGEFDYEAPSHALGGLTTAKRDLAALGKERDKYKDILAGTAKPGDVVMDAENRPIAVVNSGKRYLKPNHDAIQEMIVENVKATGGGGDRIIDPMRSIQSTTWKAAGKAQLAERGLVTETEVRRLRQTRGD